MFNVDTNSFSWAVGGWRLAVGNTDHAARTRLPS
jgi:hypothetical protein